MIHIGERKIEQNNRLGVSLKVARNLGFIENEYVYVFIKDGELYISALQEYNLGVPINCEKRAGRVTIPKDIMKALALEVGDTVNMYTMDKSILIKKKNYDREINIVRDLARECTQLHRDEKALIDKLLTRMLIK